jgi:hypothetical protein
MTPPRPPDLAPLTAEERDRALAELAQARAVGDAGAAAAVNGRLARDARLRAWRVLDYWLARRDPKSGLWAHTKGRPRWVPQNTGADLWPHLLSAAYELAPEHGPVVAEALARERAVCGALPCTVLLSPVQAAGPPMPFRLAQAAEYAADGLLPPAERYGRGPWFDRLVEVTDALVAEIGPRAATGDSETDGNLLQALARLAHATRDDRIVTAAERMADCYLLEWVPAAGGLPPRRARDTPGRGATPTARPTPSSRCSCCCHSLLRARARPSSTPSCPRSSRSKTATARPEPATSTAT